MKTIELSDGETTLLSATLKVEYDLYCEAVNQAEEDDEDKDHIKELIRDRDLTYDLLVKLGADLSGIRKQEDYWIREIGGWRFHCPVCGAGSPDARPTCKECGISLKVRE